MKKGDTAEGLVERIDFPNKGVVRIDTKEGTEYAVVKNALPGQRVLLRISKKKHGNMGGRLLKVMEESPYCTEAKCPHAGICGGCLYQGMSYEKQLAIKDEQIRRLLVPVLGEEAYDRADEGILPSPLREGYRNKMELTFGDDEPGGMLQLGMHVRGSFYDIVTTDGCRIMDADMRRVLSATLRFFREKQITYYHKRTHEGYLRHLLLRKAAKTGEILICLVTSSDIGVGTGHVHRETSERMSRSGDAEPGAGEADGASAAENRKADEFGLTQGEANLATIISATEKEILAGWMEELLAEHYDGRVAGILHTRNDRPADVIEDQGTTVLYGQGYFTEKLLELSFRITPFSFFQTNSLGAEVLNEKAREYILDTRAGSGDDKTLTFGNDGDVKTHDDGHATERVNCLTENEDTAPNGKSGTARKAFGRIFDLYSGTGTIAQILAPAAGEVIGVEIVEEAVEAAEENAKANGLANCRFISGDVLKVLDAIGEKPDMIVLDPPRDGIHPRALPKLIAYGVERILYISCKPTSLARDLPAFLSAGYQVERLCKVDMFPMTGGVETVCLLSKGDVKSKKIRVEFSLEDMDMDGFKKGATYNAIRDWIKEKYGYRVTNLNIAQMKQKHGIIERENYNKPKSPDSKQPSCPSESPISEADLNATNDMPPTKGRGRYIYEEKVKAIEEAMRHFQMI